MPRPVSIDRAQALEQAMLLFWRRGYHQTSMREITAATRLLPGSLYGAFGSKRGLYLAALDHYHDGLQQALTAHLQGTAPPLERIRRFFAELLNGIARDPEGKGCLLINTLLEPPAADAEITQQAAAALAEVEAAFAVALEEAVGNGELADGPPPEARARLLMTGIYGLRVYQRTTPPAGVLNDIVETLLKVTLENPVAKEKRT